MQIVILDGYTLNPGDLSWQPLASMGELSCYERTAPQDVLARCKDAEILLTNKTVLDAKTLKQLPNLKYIGVLATGTNVVDIDAATALGILVTNVPGYGPDAVAQMVFAHILHATQQVARHSEAVKQGQWSESEDFCFTLSPLQSLKGKTLGLIGFGDIGQATAQIAKAFGMRVIVNTRNAKVVLPTGCTWVTQDSLFVDADIVSLHCPLTASTDKLINRSVLKQMKPTAMLINTARGGLVDELALADALAQGQIAFSGVDVLSSEPPQASNPLLKAPNISISPHNAWATIEARQNLLNIAVNNVSGFLKGDAVNTVN
ncbi:glycerate dehydrogenase [Shewanella sp. Choline-02u-19]|uniref:D-2-hydroxyacid dehydrogenase n=1 Tax=unclassified Shewanella TaxID=196818 RepID=UPI000C33FF30|nr:MULTISPECIES: D-2-hydroxyacid dehydrogenase [unclassified Shewanella]PKG57860.1 glycerate dehydrogenase [Shewanella sp. GutDb-MelDb]PKG76051.1 glycerate dehydrogenase [Shewanella sp. GutCb]PKH56668.1 glycerate dehydrogenase [Shewanella sp. Bg11-22]PKI30219.1 glycerate dehydrogenase [Shewanella sp. Choline-02u-19]